MTQLRNTKCLKLGACYLFIICTLRRAETVGCHCILNWIFVLITYILELICISIVKQVSFECLAGRLTQNNIELKECGLGNSNVFSSVNPCAVRQLLSRTKRTSNYCDFFISSKTRFKFPPSSFTMLQEEIWQLPTGI